jgi:WD40 repeat protein
MRKAMLLLAVFGLVGLLWAQSPFDGTWKIDLGKAQFSEKPEVLVIQNGTFQCSTCDPKINVKADGTDQTVQGSKDFDTVAVKIVDDKTVELTNKKSGRVVELEKSTVSADGKMTTLEFTAYPEASKQPVTGKATYVRVAAGPPGSHVASGSWRLQKANESENALTYTLKSSQNGLMMSNPIGESFDAKFDSKEYPVKGASGYTVSLTKVNERSIIETAKRDGKIVEVNHMTVSADGKTLTIKSENKVRGTTETLTATKQ